MDIQERAIQKFRDDYRKYSRLSICPEYISRLMRDAMSWKAKNCNMNMAGMKNEEGKQDWASFPILSVCESLIERGEFDFTEILASELSEPKTQKQTGDEKFDSMINDKPFE